jgi:hypothetical protein
MKHHKHAKETVSKQSFNQTEGPVWSVLARATSKETVSKQFFNQTSKQAKE